MDKTKLNLIDQNLEHNLNDQNLEDENSFFNLIKVVSSFEPDNSFLKDIDFYIQIKNLNIERKNSLNRPSLFEILPKSILNYVVNRFGYINSKKIYENFCITFFSKDNSKIKILGQNGVGKSTLLELLFYTNQAVQIQMKIKNKYYDFNFFNKMNETDLEVWEELHSLFTSNIVYEDIIPSISGYYLLRESFITFLILNSNIDQISDLAKNNINISGKANKFKVQNCDEKEKIFIPFSEEVIYVLFRHLLGDDVGFIISSLKMSKEAWEVLYLLAKLNVLTKEITKKKMFQNYSEGTKQQLKIAIMLLEYPFEFILNDEMYTNIDVKTKKLIGELIDKLQVVQFDVMHDLDVDTCRQIVYLQRNTGVVNASVIDLNLTQNISFIISINENNFDNFVNLFSKFEEFKNINFYSQKIRNIMHLFFYLKDDKNSEQEKNSCDQSLENKFIHYGRLIQHNLYQNNFFDFTLVDENVKSKIVSLFIENETK